MIKDEMVQKVVEAVLAQLSQEGQAPVAKATPASAGCCPAPPPVNEDDFLSDISEYDLREKTFLANPRDPEGLKRLKATTPARIGVGRAGPRYLTMPYLRFRADHAAAEDAVMGEVSEELIERMGWLPVQSAAVAKKDFLALPDSGKRLNPQSAELLRAKAIKKAQVQILVVDGLSSSAIEANAADFLAALEQGLNNLGLKTGTPIFVKYGRVAVMNDIGQILEPDVVIELIGERQGLVTANSMSCYMCWRPRHTTLESDRSMIANIHDGGMPAAEAGAAVAAFAKRIYDNQASGNKLSTK